MVYWGSWDGIEPANDLTDRQVWTTSLGTTHQILSFDTTNRIPIGGTMGGRKHLFRIKSGLYSSCECAIKRQC